MCAGQPKVDYTKLLTFSLSCAIGVQSWGDTYHDLYDPVELSNIAAADTFPSEVNDAYFITCQCDVKTVIYNIENTPALVTLYWIKPRQRIASGQFSNFATDMNTAAGLDGTGGDELRYGESPFRYTDFCRKYKIYKTKYVRLGVDKSYTFRTVDKRERKFYFGNISSTAVTGYDFIPESRSCMMRLQGPLARETTTDAPSSHIANVVANSWVHYKYIVPPNANKHRNLYHSTALDAAGATAFMNPETRAQMTQAYVN